MRVSWHLLDLRTTRPGEWWRFPLIGFIVSAPISFTTSLFLASYGAQGPYGGFWRLLFAGLAASVPIFALSGMFFAPVEIWLKRRDHRVRARNAGLLRAGVLALAGIIGALVAYAIVVWALPTAPPRTLLPVLLVTYPLDTAIVGLAYTLYDQYFYQLHISTQLTEEMRVARKIQQGLFPRQYPQVDGYSLAARCLPAREAGGDFYDFIELRDGRLGLVIADVAGKGMPAALLVANARSTWRAEARLARGPAETLRRTNRSLCHDINSNGFVTFLYAVLDPSTAQIRVASAGHPLPLLKNDSGISEIEVYGLPLGLEPDADYDEVQVSLVPGDALLFYTDGITEAMNSSRELFGLGRLTAFLQGEGQRPADALVEGTLAAAQSFHKSAGQDDDMTIIVLKANG